MKQAAPRNGKRVSALVTSIRTEDPPPFRKWHRIIQRPGQSYDEALAAYGGDRIAPEDGIIVRRIVFPPAH